MSKLAAHNENYAAFLLIHTFLYELHASTELIEWLVDYGATSPRGHLTVNWSQGPGSMAKGVPQRACSDWGVLGCVLPCFPEYFSGYFWGY